jgi:hypothetical protein
VKIQVQITIQSGEGKAEVVHEVARLERGPLRADTPGPSLDEARSILVKFPQRHQNSHRIFRNLLCSKNFRQFCGSQNWLLFTPQFHKNLI